MLRGVTAMVLDIPSLNSVSVMNYLMKHALLNSTFKVKLKHSTQVIRVDVILRTVIENVTISYIYLSSKLWWQVNFRSHIVITATNSKVFRFYKKI
jgi:hypothetical protein